MAAAIVKKACVQCLKGGGIISCDGCQQSYCIKHIMEHRQELAVKLDNIGQEHDIFRRDLTQEDVTHPLLLRIDEWEREALNKIQITAEVARADLRQLMTEIKNRLNQSVDKVSNEMQVCRQQDDYTEIDLQRWTEQLQELRRLFEIQMNFQLINDSNSAESIHMIKIGEQNSPSSVIISNDKPAVDVTVRQEIVPLNYETFDGFYGKILLSEDRLLATCVGIYWDGSNVFGTRSYATGIHRIRFRIENKATNNLFFGIKTALFNFPVQTLTSPHVYGWWELEQGIESVNGYRMHSDRTMRTGDEITLMLDCDNQYIQLEHHRVNMVAQLPVDLGKCPLPWNTMITLRSTGDRVRIIV